MNNTQVTVDTYNKKARTYSNEAENRGVAMDLLSNVFPLIKVKKPFVVELGCGGGRDAAEILKNTDRYLGMDASVELIKIARRNVPKGEFLVSDFNSFEFPQDVDLIVAFASLLHASRETMKVVLDRAWDSLNENGVFFMTLQYGEYKEIVREDEMGKRVFYLYTPEMLEDIVSEKFEKAYCEVYELRDKKWMSIGFRKASGRIVR